MSGGAQSGSARCRECIPQGEKFIEGSEDAHDRANHQQDGHLHASVQSFNLSGMEEMEPAGTYTVETDEELLQTSLPAYRRISTLMRLPARTTGTVLTQIVEVNPVELAAVLARDSQPEETVPQPAHNEGVVRRESTASRIEFIREGWKHWLTLNANDLVWTALVIGGVLFTALLMRG
jgi:hypothetical protein